MLSFTAYEQQIMELMENDFFLKPRSVIVTWTMFFPEADIWFFNYLVSIALNLLYKIDIVD